MNPHTRYEIPIDPAGRWVAFSAVVLTTVIVVSVLWLAVTTPGAIIPVGPRVQLPHVPTSTEIQQKIDSHNPVVQAVEGKVR